MTLLDYRYAVASLVKLAMDPDDKLALEQSIKNVATYRTLTSVDIDTVKRLVAKYTQGAA